MRLENFLAKLFKWSYEQFGPPFERGPEGPIAHLRKEIEEVEEEPYNLEEWIDCLFLSFEGAFRAGYTPVEIVEMLQYKMRKNKARIWPNWRDVKPGVPIEHIREVD